MDARQASDGGHPDRQGVARQVIESSQDATATAGGIVGAEPKEPFGRGDM
ncbi:MULTISPECIES: hypothetical protein [Streptomyces]|nr:MULTISPECIES: hypothetical protein [Streptomyces]